MMSEAELLERPAPKGSKAGKRAGTIEVQAGHLAKVMRQIDKLVERKNTVPLLGMVRIDVGPTGMKLCATDHDIWASDRVDASCSPNEIVKFSTCVSARKLFEAVNMLPAEASVRLTQIDMRLHVEARGVFGPVNYRFPTLPVDEFPSAPRVDALAEFVMPAFALATAIDAVRGSISTEETRYYLNGIFWHVLDGQLVMAATDGHRLSRHRAAMPEGAESMADSIIHRKSISMIAAIIDHLDGKAADETDVEISVGHTRIALTIGTCDLTAKLIDGKFPDYSRVVPTSNDKIAKLRPAHLAGAVRQVMLMGSEKTRAVKCQFGGGQMSVHFTSPENGEASAELGCDYSGDPLTIGFNATYLLAILDRMGGEECTIELDAPSAPTLIRNYEGASSDYVLMPMRV
jgi:DNA polymerase-3 subunit beta